ncbi:MAG TPA: hypothetical protein VI365_18255, partial [Trebonia sp.]
ITRLNSGLFRDLGLTGEEVGTLISVLTKMRRSWGDFDKESEEELLAIGAGPFHAGEGRA